MKVKKSFKRILAVALLVAAMCFAVPSMAAAVPNLIGGNITSMTTDPAVVTNSYGIDDTMPIILSFDGSATSLSINNFALATTLGGNPIGFTLATSGNLATLTPDSNAYPQNQQYTLTYQETVSGSTNILATINFKTKLADVGGGQARLYCIGAYVDNGTNFVDVASGQDRVPLNQNITFAFTNNVPAVTNTGAHDNSNGIIMYKWKGSTVTPPSNDFTTNSDWEPIGRTLVFGAGSFRWLIGVTATGGLVQNTFYGLHVLVPTWDEGGQMYNEDGLCANNGTPLQQEKRVVFRTESII